MCLNRDFCMEKLSAAREVTSFPEKKNKSSKILLKNHQTNTKL